MLSAKNIHDGQVDFQEEHRLISIDDFKLENKRTDIQCGDVLLTIVGALGRTALVGVNSPKFTLQRSVAVLSAPIVNPKYFRYSLEDYGFQKQIIENAKGTAQKGVYLNKLKELEISLPPLAEQKVIADKLDTLLAQVENTKTRLERIPEILKRFRQSVLAAAVSGRLTEEWRSSGFDAHGDPTTWPRKKLSEVGDLARGRSKHRPRNDPRLFGGEYPFIQTGDVSNSGGKISTASNFYSAFGLNQSRLFHRGTLCITIAANIADTGILEIDACFPDSIVGFTPNTQICHAKFIKYFIDINKNNLEVLAPATAQKNINLKVLDELELNLPSINEQTEIVRRVEQLFAYADTLERQTQNALARVNNLTQSILAKAFRGELTAEWRAANPDLISGDNSAEALLEKIKAEREALAKQPARRKTHVPAR